MTMPRESILRLIDANLNRCREGLRVIEDCARFVLNDASISEQCKVARHRLRWSVDELGIEPMDLIHSRNTLGDVGTTIQTDAEGDRSAGMRDIVSAAAKRATEALRVLEEASKGLGKADSRFEAIRYQLYTIEKQTMLALAPRCGQWSLCVLVSEELCTHLSPAEIVKRAAAAGTPCIQIREKLMPTNRFLDHAGALTTLAHQLGMEVIINDAVEIAQIVDADGVHLGQDDLPIRAARSLLGPRKWIGKTCPTILDAHQAKDDGADYCGIGPVFASTTKAKPTLGGIELVSSYLDDPKTDGFPMLAISGISPTNIDQLASVGCPGVAVSGCVCSSEDPESVCRAIIEAVESNSVDRAPTIRV